MYTLSFCKNVAQMPDWGCGDHNRGHLQSSCKCHTKNSKGFYPSAPRYHFPDKPLQFNRKPKHKPHKSFSKKNPHKFIKRRSYQADSKAFFLCGKSGHWANKCPKKKSKPKLAAFCDNLDPKWWDQPN